MQMELYDKVGESLEHKADVYVETRQASVVQYEGKLYVPLQMGKNRFSQRGGHLGQRHAQRGTEHERIVFVEANALLAQPVDPDDIALDITPG